MRPSPPTPFYGIVHSLSAIHARHFAAFCNLVPPLAASNSWGSPAGLLELSATKPASHPPNACGSSTSGALADSALLTLLGAYQIPTPLLLENTVASRKRMLDSSIWVVCRVII